MLINETVLHDTADNSRAELGITVDVWQSGTGKYTSLKCKSVYFPDMEGEEVMNKQQLRGEKRT